MDRFVQDFRYALRSCVKRPAFTAVVVATLALGIGANTAIFTLVNEIVLRPLPIGEPSRVVDLFAKTPGGNSFTGFSYADYREYRDRNEVLSDLAAFMGMQVRLGPDMATESVSAQFTSANYFDVIDVEPALGRAFGDHEGVLRGGHAVAVISHRFWQRRAGGEDSVLGSTLRINDTPFTVIGVAPEGFEGTFVGFPMELWLPLPAAEMVLPNFDLTDGSRRGLELIGRLGPGFSVERARAAFEVLAVQLEKEHPILNRGHRVGVVPTTGVDHSMRVGVLGFLGVLMVVAGLVLLITCLNVGSLLLARATARQKEMSIRFAMGAGAGRLTRQLLTEAVVLFLLGAALGAFVATRLTGVLLRFIASLPVPLGFDLGLDWRVLLFTAGAALVTALLAGIFPAREALRRDPIAVLRGGASDDGRRAGRLRNAFVVAQIAGAVALLIGAGLFLRSLQAGMTLDPGFEADLVAATTVTLPDDEYDRPLGLQFFATLHQRVASLPGVESVALARRRPIGVTKNPVEIEVPGYEPPPDQTAVFVDANSVSSEYLQTMRIPLIAGRDFRPDEGAEAQRVAIVNTTMAEQFWPRDGAVGQSFTLGEETVTVVGVARDSRYMIQDDLEMAHIYLPAAQNYAPRMTILVRAADDPLALRARVQQAISALDPDLPRIDFVTLRQTINLSLLPQRVAAAVTVGLGLFGLFLAALGIYGILAHAVSRRTREIGIRIALGGRPGDVVRLVVGTGLRLAAFGIALGLGLGLAIGPLLRSFLVGVRPTDPLTLAAVAGLFLLIASVACFLPARRATRIDPTTTLRFD